MDDIITYSTVEKDNDINLSDEFRQIIFVSFDGYSSDAVEWYVPPSLCIRSKVKRGVRKSSQLQL
jgi:hypothetical protein